MAAHRRGSRLGAWLIRIFLVLAAFVPPAHALQIYIFDIPSQPLDEALQVFGGVTGLQLLYESDLASARISAPVKGALTAATALETLLAGTGLRARQVGDSYTIAPVPTAAPLPGAAVETLSLQRHGAFLAAAQRNLLAALCRTPLTTPGGYRIVAEVRFAPTGVVEAVQIVRGSGSRVRDAAVSASLRSVSVPLSPPPDMPQPLRMVIADKDASGECASATNLQHR